EKTDENKQRSALGKKGRESNGLENSSANTAVKWGAVHRNSGCPLAFLACRVSLYDFDQPLKTNVRLNSRCRGSLCARRLCNRTDTMSWPYQMTMDSSNIRPRSSGPAERGESLVTRCCGSVPSTSAGMSSD